MKKKIVAIGLLGPTLDKSAKNQKRWERWRPSVALHQQPDLIIDRFELLNQKKFDSLGDLVSSDIQVVSPETTVSRQTIEFTDPWDFEQVYSSLYDFAIKYPFDTDKEDYLIHITTGTHVAQICLYLLTETNIIPAKLIQTSPTFDGDKSPAGRFTIIDLDLSKYDLIAQRFEHQHQQAQNFLKAGIQTKNKKFNSLIQNIEHVATNATDPILLTGSTGVGKTQLARKIYELKKNTHQITGPFVELNCATIQSTAAASALFGHKKGAFTGAAADRPGLLKQANNGLLFLDEIGELGLDEQAMLLRAIEDKRFLPLGADTEAKSNFQLICGTNRDLLKEVAQGKFREDLLARINLWSFKLPDLADRKEDIPPNIEFELNRITQKTGTKSRFNKQALIEFTKFAQSSETKWSGNFRDLGAAITRMTTLAKSGRITTTEVQDEITRLKHAWRGSADVDGQDQVLQCLGKQGAEEIDPFDRVQLNYVIQVCKRCASMAQAGRELYRVSREGKKKANDSDRLRKYLAKFGLSWDDLSR